MYVTSTFDFDTIVLWQHNSSPLKLGAREDTAQPCEASET